MTKAKERYVPEVAVRLRPAMIAYVGVCDPGGAREDAFLSESDTLLVGGSTSLRSITILPPSNG